MHLSDIVDREIPRVKPDDILSDLFEASVDTSMPLPVVDERERILGIVPRVALLSSMTTNTGTLDLPQSAALTDPQLPVVPEEQPLRPPRRRLPPKHRAPSPERRPPDERTVLARTIRHVDRNRS